ncbi:MAG: sulfite exporter TauE/SafE family protein [Desulfovibrio sp.]|nr:sulfite exporter TauE/SafE family protein [Desulfovibrio sp.]
MYFPTAEITCNPFIPFFIALSVSFFASMGGISGGVLLLPFEMSVLGYTNPSVSATNHFYNILACPAGVYRFWKEGRLILPLVTTIAVGTLPGVFIGAVIRVTLLPDPSYFKVFAGTVLLYIAFRMVKMLKNNSKRLQASPGIDNVSSVTENSSSRLTILFQGDSYTVEKHKLMFLSLCVGLIGGVYGIGGGAIMSPFLISFFGFPVYIVAGATLMATAITSLGGVLSFALLSTWFAGISVAPDIRLGIITGLGGMLGIYFGAKCQKYVSVTLIKFIIVAILIVVALRYITQIFL